MIELTARVQNCAGIHCRPSTLIVSRVRGYEGRISIESTTGESDLRSVMGLLMLQLQHGSELTVRVDGPGEAETGRMLVDLFQTRFDFPQQTN